METFIEGNLGVFLMVTVIIGGGTAYMTGRAVAMTWRPSWQLGLYVFVLAAATRFVHYALFGADLLSIRYYLVDLVVLAAIAALGFRITEVASMTRQYSWLYERSSLLSLRDKR